jgi:hypothetical protein
LNNPISHPSTIIIVGGRISSVEVPRGSRKLWHGGPPYIVDDAFASQGDIACGRSPRFHMHRHASVYILISGIFPRLLRKQWLRTVRSALAKPCGVAIAVLRILMGGSSPSPMPLAANFLKPFSFTRACSLQTSRHLVYNIL